MSQKLRSEFVFVIFLFFVLFGCCTNFSFFQFNSSRLLVSVFFVSICRPSAHYHVNIKPEANDKNMFVTLLWQNFLSNEDAFVHNTWFEYEI